jgi:hypothetical protein
MQGMSVSFSIPVDNTRYADDGSGNTVMEELPTSTFSGTILLSGSGTLDRVRDRSFLTYDGQTQFTLHRGRERPAIAEFDVAVDGEPLATEQGTGGLIATTTGKITSAPPVAVVPRPLRVPSPRPGTTSFLSESSSLAAYFSHGDDPGCLQNNLDVSAGISTLTTHPDGQTQSQNTARLELSSFDNCEEGVSYQLRISLEVQDAAELTGTLETGALSIDRMVSAERCIYVIATEEFDCERGTAHLDAALLWEGTGDVQGGTSSSVSRTATEVRRIAQSSYGRVAQLTKSILVDGQEIEFGGSYASSSLGMAAFYQGTTPR